ncbi:uncharacterized protein LOC121899351 isoform X1 [Thunnus maccoyii]|uniref:uncharacterized protein LOC121899351 isoform X1 n=1 Tax=Thunnus maccoyii TaxID=8240 RepID=UPI001C4CDB14|nr:uncharacterized protein LOC121899351 isoform X1 [Thunnus maccoyii]
MPELWPFEFSRRRIEIRRPTTPPWQCRKLTVLITFHLPDALRKYLQRPPAAGEVTSDLPSTPLSEAAASQATFYIISNPPATCSETQTAADLLAGEGTTDTTSTSTTLQPADTINWNIS